MKNWEFELWFAAATVLEKMDELRDDQLSFWDWLEGNASSFNWGYIIERAYFDAQDDWKYAPVLFELRRLLRALNARNFNDAEYYANSVAFMCEES